MIFKNLSVVKKIWGSYFVVFVVFGFVSAILVNGMLTLNNKISILTDKSLPSIEVLKDIEIDITKVRKNEFSLLANSNHQKIGEWVEGLEKKRLDVQKGISDFEELDLNQREKKSFKKFKDYWVKYINETKNYNDLLKKGNIDSANKIILSSYDTYLKAFTSLEKTLLLNKEAVHSVHGEVVIAGTFTKYSAGIGAIFILVMMGGASLLLSRSICRPVNYALNLTKKIANGELNNDIDENILSNDELGTLLRELAGMQRNLHSLVSEIDESVVQLSSVVEEVSTIASQTASEMQGQQNELSSVASAMTEMQAAVKEVAQNTEVGAASSYSATTLSKQGTATLHKTIAVIEKVSNTIQESEELSQELEINSNNINIVVDVIRGIAEQTNLLALNAAIEAARAGEQGRGFAVVADEVRSLAQRTQDSTSQIIETVSQLQEKTVKMTQSSQSCQRGIADCIEQVNIAENQITEIEHSIDNISQMSTQIATSCSEQDSVSEELSRSVECINSSSKEITQGSSQTATACQQINSLVQNLKLRVDSFQI